MAVNELSEHMLAIKAEMRRGDERIDQMFREMEEANRRYSAETAALIAEMEAARQESRAFRRELRAKIDRLPPPAQAA